jgi:phosphoribosylanthranilate isomerase
MHVRVKICGVTSPEAIEAAVGAGADAVGFVLADSPRRVTLERARELARSVPAFVSRVAVFRRPRWTDVEEANALLHPDWIQLDFDTPATTGGDPEIRLLPVVHDEPARNEEIDRFVDRLAAEKLPILFESALSGGGQTANWERAAQLARRVRLVLAGGLRPENVGEAIRRVRPYGVDVSSGVEREPGVKGPQKIEAFLLAVRRAELELEGSR